MIGAGLLLVSAAPADNPFPTPLNEVKVRAFEVLDTRCNVCHRKQNPFKVFSLKNMDKHAPKIYEQVFVKGRMPKGDSTPLTSDETRRLATWLATHNLN